MTPLDAALAWIRKGFSPVPVPYRSKKPILENWQQLEITVEAAPAYFGNPALNIGLLLGDKFGSADVDCDCLEAIAGARELLQETGLVFVGNLSLSRTTCIDRSTASNSEIS
jgi:hypothetical protein